MTNKILNVLEEIKKLRVENANKSNIVIHPTRFANNIDKVANTTRAYTEKIYGSKPDHFSSHTSNYKDSIRSVEHLSQFKHSPDVSHSTYFSNFYGIPKIKEMSNNENTLYYEKKLGQKSELDFAVENFDGSESKAAIVAYGSPADPVKEKAIKEIIEKLKIKRNKDNVIKHIGDIASYTPPAGADAPTATAGVKVSPAFTSDKPKEPAFVEKLD
jgi:hypothetical protein